MTKQKVATHCGMVGYGDSAKEAKDDARRRLSAVMEGHWPVTLLEHCGLLAVIARQPHDGEQCWGFLVRPVGSAQGQHFLDPNYPNEEAAVEAACYSLAQQAGTYRNLPRQLSQARRRELDAWYRWQEAYERARTQGATTDDARVAADEFASQPTTGWTLLQEALSERGMRNTMQHFAVSSFNAVGRVLIDEACDGWIAHNAAGLMEVAVPNPGSPDLDAAQALLGRFGPTTRRNASGNVELVAGFIESYGRRVLLLAGNFVAAFDVPQGDLSAAIDAVTADGLSNALILIE